MHILLSWKTNSKNFMLQNESPPLLYHFTTKNTCRKCQNNKLIMTPKCPNVTPTPRSFLEKRCVTKIIIFFDHTYFGHPVLQQLRFCTKCQLQVLWGKSVRNDKGRWKTTFKTWIISSVASSHTLLQWD